MLDYNINYNYAPKRRKTGSVKKRKPTLVQTNTDNHSRNAILRRTGNPEGVLPKLKERPLVRKGTDQQSISYDPAVSSMLDVNSVIPGRPSSPHILESQTQYKAGMPLTSDGSHYNVGGDWSPFINPETGKYRLPILKNLDAADQYVRSGLIRPYNYGHGNIKATMNLGDLFTDMHLVPGHLQKSINVSRQLMDSIGRARTNASKEYIGDIGTLNEGEQAPNWNDYNGDKKAFNKDRRSYRSRSAATLLNSIYNDSTHPLTRPIMMTDQPLTQRSTILSLEGFLPKGYEVLGEDISNIRFFDKYPEANMQYRRTGDLPINLSRTISGGGSLYGFPSDAEKTPYINIGETDKYNGSPSEDNIDLHDLKVINEYPLNITNSSLGLKPFEITNNPGAVTHEGIHGMTNYVRDNSRDAYSDLYGISRDRPGYTLMGTGEALRSHRVMKTAFARDLIRQGLSEQEIVNRVQDPQAFLQWLDTTIYNGGEGGGFSFPEGIVPAGMEEEYYRAATGLRPFTGEILDKVEQYNSWNNNDTPNRVKVITSPADPNYSKLTPQQRLELFYKLHPQVRNTRSNNIYNLA